MARKSVAPISPKRSIELGDRPKDEIDAQLARMAEKGYDKDYSEDAEKIAAKHASEGVVTKAIFQGHFGFDGEWINASQYTKTEAEQQTAETHRMAAETLATTQAIAAKLAGAPEHNNDSFLTHIDIAKLFPPLSAENARKRLDYWRGKHQDLVGRDFHEAQDRRGRSPSYLYRLGAVRQIFEAE